jgi:hypothetical protein
MGGAPERASSVEIPASSYGISLPSLSASFAETDSARRASSSLQHTLEVWHLDVDASHACLRPQSRASRGELRRQVSPPPQARNDELRRGGSAAGEPVAADVRGLGSTGAPCATSLPSAVSTETVSPRRSALSGNYGAHAVCGG